MTIKEAYDRGLLVVGRKIKTNGNMSAAQPLELYATIIKINHIYLIIKFEKNQGIYSNYVDWYINISNCVATIQLPSKTVEVVVLSYITEAVLKCKINDTIAYIKVTNKKYVINNSYTMRIYKVGCYYIEE